MRKFTREEFIEKAKQIHGDKYDYSMVEYVNNSTKVCIICPVHGEFWQRPSDHLKGYGCNKCKYKYIWDNRGRKTTEEWIEEAKKVHGDKYDYSKAEYKGSDEKVCIICPEHGEFWQLAANHLKGEGCQQCKGDKFSKERSMGKDKFVERATNLYNGKYDYSKVVYKNNSTKVTIICPIHGEFSKTPANHLNGQGCPMCAKKPKKPKVKKERYKITTEEFIQRARKVHGDKYDYSKSKYVKSSIKTTIICPTHGEFQQKPNKHLSGQGCPKCNVGGKPNTKSIDDVLLKFREVHGYKYEYDFSTYEGTQKKMRIICPEHGEFWQNVGSHISGRGCPKCAEVARRKKTHKPKEIFVNEANVRHNNKYDYSETELNGMSKPIKVICHEKYADGREHGAFYVNPNKHLFRGTGCPHCKHSTSQAELEIYRFVCDLVGIDNVRHNDRTVLKGYELDIYIPSHNLAIEYDGLYWHSEANPEYIKGHMLHKTEECEKQGIHLIHIFEDEYANNKEVVFSKLKHLLNTDNSRRIYARKCVVKEIDRETGYHFIQLNHIQGKANSTVFVGAYYNDELVSVMSFLLEDKKNMKWNLTRFCNKSDCNIIGIGGKLISYFRNHYDYTEIKTFADRRWSSISNNLYEKIGFKLTKIISPDYRYIAKNAPSEGRIHKFNCRKNILAKKYNLPLTMTETEMATTAGLYKVWDCGLLKYVISNE